MCEHLWLPFMATVAAIALSAILFKEFLKKRAGQTAVEGSADNDSAAENGTVESAARTCTLPQVNETATSSGYDYEVFLSFRGPDTRSGFTDFLYTSLTNARIRTFRDDEELRISKEFSAELLQAINQSKILIPIFSKGYASSAWCLKELVQMVKCRKTKEQKIMPIFYDVAPSEVRHQTRGYGEAFLLYESKKQYDKETIREWKAALQEVSSLNGWDLHNMPNRREGEFATKLTQEVFRELKKAYLVVSDCLVNVDNHVDAIMEMIGARTSETRIIGIHGMGGIGKTTIAKIIYNRLSRNFEDCCFLSNIRETSKNKGVECLQKQLISDILKTKETDINNVDEGTQKIKDRFSNKRVLLLLDDVENEDHIDALVGKRDWFGRGSKIIITTRNKDILRVPKVDHNYELKCMDRNQSLQLFSKHAFRRDSPLEEYMDQSNRAISIAGGLPLALEVIGSLLCPLKKEKWDGKLKELENVPPENVMRKLEISYNALRVREQYIFLDIACLFIGYDKDDVVYFWDEYNFFPKEAMDVLENMSLIKINEDNELWMHDQLRDLGREIVRQESKMKIEKQSRVWDPKDGLNLLRRPKVNKEVEALCLKLDSRWQYCFTYEGFESLSNLRFLEVDDWFENFRAEERLLWCESSSNLIKTNENSDLLPQLRWLSWFSIPPNFNITKFSMENVVVLDLSDSDITDDWKGWSHIKVMEKLKVMNLSGCRLLERLPDKLGEDLASLEDLSLRWCSSLHRLPDTIGNLKLLIKLDISGTNFRELPDSIGKLQNLKVMKMQDCVLKIPDAFWMLEKLEEIEGIHEYWGGHLKIGDCIYKNQSLRILRLWSANIYELPRLPESLIILQLGDLCMDTYPDLSNLTNLKQLDLTFGCSDRSSCGHVEDPLPLWIGNLRKLEFLALQFNLWGSNSPKDLCRPYHLEAFRPPRLPSSLSSLRLDTYDAKDYYIRWVYRI